MRTVTPRCLFACQ